MTFGSHEDISKTLQAPVTCELTLRGYAVIASPGVPKSLLLGGISEMDRNGRFGCAMAQRGMGLLPQMLEIS